MTDLERLNEEAAEKKHLQQEQLQQKSRLMIYLSFAFVLSTAFVVYLYFVNVDYKKTLLEQQEKMIEQQAIISAQKNEMSAFIDSLASQLHSRNDYAINASPGPASANDPGVKTTEPPPKPAATTPSKPTRTPTGTEAVTGTSPSATTTKPATPASKPTGTAQQVQQVANIDRLLERSINSKYYVGLHTFNASEAQIQQLQQYLKNQGYFFDETSYHYQDSKPSWMAYEPTVFYYSPDSREKATMLARELYNQTRIRFTVKQGAGLGVVAGQEAFTFYIHLINR